MFQLPGTFYYRRGYIQTRLAYGGCFNGTESWVFKFFLAHDGGMFDSAMFQGLDDIIGVLTNTFETA